VQPVGHEPGLGVADLAEGLVAGAQAAELGQQPGGPGERPAGPGQGEQLGGVRADEAGDAQTVVERVTAGGAARAGQIEAVQPDRAGGGQQVAADAALVPQGLAAAGAGAGRRPFFSACSAWACRAASTA